VVSRFEGTIERATALAVLMPIVAGQGGNAGTQTLTLIIRGMALGEVSLANGLRALWKEVRVGLLNGFAIGLVVGGLSYLWQGNPYLGLVIGLAMVLNLVAAAVAGVLIPLGLRLLGIDPALASAIFLTTVTDCAGFFFFLGLGTLFLAHLR
jgi:magnesium transporter